MALIARAGDAERGAIYVRVQRPDRTSVLFGPAPAVEDEGERRFMAVLGSEPVPDGQVDQVLARQMSFDEDIWIVDVDDREGRHFLEDELDA